MRAQDRQSCIGLAAAAGIVIAWLAIHFGAIFLWRWTPATIVAAAPVVVVQAWLSMGLFIVAHDCMHGSLAPGRPRLNVGIGTLCLGIYAGLSYGRVRPKHFEHHREPGSAADPDFNPDDPRAFAPWLLRFFRGYYTHAQILRITVVACVYMLLGASLVNIVVFWAAPALLALVQLFLFGTYLPHRDQGEPFADAHRARSNGFSPAASLISCFHFGACHHEHHLSPSTPWWALPALRSRARRGARVEPVWP